MNRFKAADEAQASAEANKVVLELQV